MALVLGGRGDWVLGLCELFFRQGYFSGSVLFLGRYGLGVLGFRSRAGLVWAVGRGYIWLFFCGCSISFRGFDAGMVVYISFQVESQFDIRRGSQNRLGRGFVVVGFWGYRGQVREVSLLAGVFFMGLYQYQGFRDRGGIGRRIDKGLGQFDFFQGYCKVVW